ncbi:MAG: F0F1 ATP synthase subunit A [Firmicutes bacterium]|nr:F0F1 ATP synthase subunit A [Bacillota bacterium]
MPQEQPALAHLWRMTGMPTGEGFLVHWLGMDWNISVIFMVGIIVVVLLVLAALAARKLDPLHPSKVQVILEFLLGFVREQTGQAIQGERAARFVNLAATLFIFIFVSNICGLFLQIRLGHEDMPLWYSPTSSLSVTVTLALVAWIWSHVNGFRFNGPHYLRRLLGPVIYMAPIFILDLFTRLITLAFRLYGNIYAGEILTSTFSHLLPIYASWIPLLIWLAYSLFVAAIQAFIFMMLSMVYIGDAINPEES